MAGPHTSPIPVDRTDCNCEQCDIFLVSSVDTLMQPLHLHPCTRAAKALHQIWVETYCMHSATWYQHTEASGKQSPKVQASELAAAQVN